jgi:hypothetical protein
MGGLRRSVAGGACGEDLIDRRTAAFAGPVPCPRLRLLPPLPRGQACRAPCNDMRAVGTWDSGPSGCGRGSNHAEQSQFALAKICLNSFTENGL